MCYSYRDRQMEEEARRKLWKKVEHKRPEQSEKEKERPAKKDRELIRA